MSNEKRIPFGGRPGKRHPLKVLDRYEVDTESGCWKWLGSIRYGYGCCSWNGKSHQAHRVFYEQHVGPIPDGLQLDHLCRNRGCVNPEHLEAVTSAENCRRRPSSILNQQKVNEIREVTDALCEKYGIKPGTLAHIAQRTRWADE